MRHLSTFSFQKINNFFNEIISLKKVSTYDLTNAIISSKFAYIKSYTDDQIQDKHNGERKYASIHIFLSLMFSSLYIWFYMYFMYNCITQNSLQFKTKIEKVKNALVFIMIRISVWVLFSYLILFIGAVCSDHTCEKYLTKQRNTERLFHAESLLKRLN